jgi:hypothetical protein
MNLEIRFPLDPVYRRLYAAVDEIVRAELKAATDEKSRELCYETLEEMEDEEWEKQDFRDYILARRRRTVGLCAVELREGDEIKN